MSTQAFIERRHRNFAGRVARITYPVRQGYEQFMGDLGDMPCYLLGHHWIEVPATHLSARARGEGRMRFRCGRCFLMGGFSNR